MVAVMYTKGWVSAVNESALGSTTLDVVQPDLPPTIDEAIVQSTGTYL
jgi:hypothetical protein